MFARDIMTHDVVSVKSDATVRDVARLLIDKAISAVPVVDDDGRPIGMVSEGDLACGNEMRRRERSQWWLAQLAEGEPLSENFLVAIDAGNCSVDKLMVQPVVTAPAEATVEEIARVMEKHKIKRVIVTAENGEMAGIVTRADIVRAVAAGQDPARLSAALWQRGRTMALD
jgi:CBS domain-containing protein